MILEIIWTRQTDCRFRADDVSIIDWTHCFGRSSRWSTLYLRVHFVNVHSIQCHNCRVVKNKIKKSLYTRILYVVYRGVWAGPCLSGCRLMIRRVIVATKQLFCQRLYFNLCLLRLFNQTFVDLFFFSFSLFILYVVRATVSAACYFTIASLQDFIVFRFC